MTGEIGQVRLTITGEPASKANSRKMVLIGGKPRFIKSQKALDWMKNAEKQIPVRDPLLTCPLVGFFLIHYASHRPDLDESLILDFLQGRIYQNDRQVRERHTYHAIDRDNPRTEIILKPLLVSK